MNSLKKFVYKYIKKPYYYVPPCPVCGSKVTGRIVSGNHRATERNWMINEALRNGELVLPKIDVEEQNCFCNDCGAAWEQTVELKFLSLDEIAEQKRIRHTSEMLEERYNEIEKEKAEAPGGVVGLFAGFIGKL